MIHFRILKKFIGMSLLSLSSLLLVSYTTSTVHVVVTLIPVKCETKKVKTLRFRLLNDHNVVKFKYSFQLGAKICQHK